MNGRTAAYWGTTALTAFVFLSGGVVALLHVEGAVRGFAALGYPPHFVTYLGAAKLLDLHPNTLRSRMKKLGITRSDHDIS